jgi:DNA repair protein RadC
MKYVKEFEVRSRRVALNDLPSCYGHNFTSPHEVAEMASRLTAGMDQEVFMVFFVDVKNAIVGYEQIAKGSVDVCPVDPKMVFRTAIHLGASNIVIAHNHPSGDPHPSPTDMSLTRRLKKGAELLGIGIVDHVIVSDFGYYSMLEQGIM